MIMLLSLATLALWAALATIETVHRDGYGRLRNRAPLYFVLP
ncbi:hypothetical protein FB562_2638 [Homoserinimonas aerilata]|uniref:Uncharacterized protein n=1 Tax=Homoserinimonas aerilata TaxID=1162970 RepID=A0A542XX97_9MICO|nr:hypothetical protein [Homoserinimonas aerilata]TQL40429.1 hypothetical protein FB562_2638 [Homoserinimonas aerilata]